MFEAIDYGDEIDEVDDAADELTSEVIPDDDSGEVDDDPSDQTAESVRDAILAAHAKGVALGEQRMLARILPLLTKAAAPASTVAPAPVDAPPSPEVALLLATLDHRIQSLESPSADDSGDATGAALQALWDDPEALAGIFTPSRDAESATFEKAWSETSHPRDDNGRFVSAKDVRDATRNPEKAKELRATVTDPAQRKKLDTLLAGGGKQPLAGTDASNSLSGGSTPQFHDQEGHEHARLVRGDLIAAVKRAGGHTGGSFAATEKRAQKELQPALDRAAHNNNVHWNEAKAKALAQFAADYPGFKGSKQAKEVAAAFDAARAVTADAYEIVGSAAFDLARSRPDDIADRESGAREDFEKSVRDAQNEYTKQTEAVWKVVESVRNSFGGTHKLGRYFKAWDENLHPRAKNGIWISRERIHEAKTDPNLAAELREEVKPADADKLDAALSGKTDLGRSKSGAAKSATAEKRSKLTANRATARKLADELLMTQHAPDPAKLRELAHHLQSNDLRVAELRDIRQKLNARFGGGRRLAEMKAALLAHVEKRAADADEPAVPDVEPVATVPDPSATPAVASESLPPVEPPAAPADPATTAPQTRRLRGPSDYAPPSEEEFAAASQPAPVPVPVAASRPLARLGRPGGGENSREQMPAPAPAASPAPVDPDAALPPMHRETIAQLKPTLERQLDREVTPHKKSQVAAGILHGEAPQVQESLARHLAEIAPDAHEYLRTKSTNAATRDLMARTQSAPARESLPAVPLDLASRNLSLKDEKLAASRESDRLFAGRNQKFTPDQDGALNWYKDGGYKRINAQLRTGTPAPDDLEQQKEDFGRAYTNDQSVAHIDAALANAKLPEPVTTYRGLQSPQLAQELLSKKPGETVTDAGYTSTSLSPQAAYNSFAALMHGKPGGAVVAKIELPAGSPALDITRAGGNAPGVEPELLLPRGTSFEVGETVEKTDGAGRKYKEVTLRPKSTSSESPSPDNPKSPLDTTARVADTAPTAPTPGAATSGGEAVNTNATATPSVNPVDVYNRSRDASHSEVNAAIRAAASMSKAEAASALTKLGYAPSGDPRRHLATLLADRKASQVRGLSSGAGRAVDEQNRAAYAHMDDEPLITPDDALGAKPVKASATAVSPVVPKPAKPLSAKAEPPATDAGKAALSVYQRAAAASDADLAAARSHLASLPKDELQRVAAAMGVSGKATAASLAKRIEDRRGTAVRTTLMDRADATPASESLPESSATGEPSSPLTGAAKARAEKRIADLDAAITAHESALSNGMATGLHAKDVKAKLRTAQKQREQWQAKLKGGSEGSSAATGENAAPAPSATTPSITKPSPKSVTVATGKDGERTTTFDAGEPERQAARLAPAIARAVDEVRYDSEDGLMTLGSIAHEVKRNDPTATDRDILAAMKHLQKTRALESHALNETQRFTDPKGGVDPLGGGTDLESSTLWDNGRALHYWTLPQGKSAADIAKAAPAAPAAAATAAKSAKATPAPVAPSVKHPTPHLNTLQSVADSTPSEVGRDYIETAIHNRRNDTPEGIASALGRSVEENYLANGGKPVSRPIPPEARAAVDAALTKLGAAPHGPRAGEQTRYDPEHHEVAPEGENWFPGDSLKVVRQPLVMNGAVVSRGKLAKGNNSENGVDNTNVGGKITPGEGNSGATTMNATQPKKGDTAKVGNKTFNVLRETTPEGYADDYGVRMFDLHDPKANKVKTAQYDTETGEWNWPGTGSTAASPSRGANRKKINWRS